MRTKAIVSVIYGVLIAFGGIMGYVMAGSMASLIAGGGLGLAAAAGGGMMWSGAAAGRWIAIASSVAVGLFFAFQLTQPEPNVGRAAGVIALTAVQLIVLFIPAKTPTQ